MDPLVSLEQKKFLKGKNSFVIRDDGLLHVSATANGSSQEFTIEMGQLNPEPIRNKKSARSMFVGLFLFVAIAGLFVVPACAPDTDTIARITSLSVGSIFVVPALLCWFGFIKQSYNIVLFQNPVTGGQLVLFADVPSQETVSAFVAKLQTEIRLRKDDMPKGKQTLPEQIKQLAQLHANGSLSDDEFDRAKRQLIEAAKTPGPIGFGF